MDTTAELVPDLLDRLDLAAAEDVVIDGGPAVPIGRCPAVGRGAPRGELADSSDDGLVGRDAQDFEAFRAGLPSQDPERNAGVGAQGAELRGTGRHALI